jgi:hypothetical protein
MGGTRCTGGELRISVRGVFYLGWLRTASSPGARLRGTYQPMGLRIPRVAIAKPCWLLLVRAWPLCWSQTSSRAGAGDPGKGPGRGAPPRGYLGLENYALCLRAIDRSQEAEPLQARARAIRAKSA